MVSNCNKYAEATSGDYCSKFASDSMLGILSWARLDRIAILNSLPDTITAYVASHSFLPHFHTTNGTCLYRLACPVQLQQPRARRPHPRRRRSQRRLACRANAQRLSRLYREITAANSRAITVSPPLSCMLGTPFSALRVKTVIQRSMLVMGTALRCPLDSICEKESSEGVTEPAPCANPRKSGNLGL
jgi:hypothetical protein